MEHEPRPVVHPVVLVVSDGREEKPKRLSLCVVGFFVVIGRLPDERQDRSCQVPIFEYRQYLDEDGPPTVLTTADGRDARVKLQRLQDGEAGIRLGQIHEAPIIGMRELLQNGAGYGQNRNDDKRGYERPTGRASLDVNEFAKLTSQNVCRRETKEGLSDGVEGAQNAIRQS